PRSMAWEWGSRSARILLKPTAGGCGLRLTYPKGLHSSLDCRLTALWPAANEFPQFVSESTAAQPRHVLEKRMGRGAPAPTAKRTAFGHYVELYIGATGLSRFAAVGCGESLGTISLGCINN